MPLLKTTNSVIARSSVGGVSRVNIDTLTSDGDSGTFSDKKGGGVFPDVAVFPVSVVVSGSTQTLTDDGSVEFIRIFENGEWGAWA